MPICAIASKVSGNFEKQCSLKYNVKKAMKNRFVKVNLVE